MAMLQVSAIAALSWQWTPRCMDYLGVFLEDRVHFITSLAVVFRLRMGRGRDNFRLPLFTMIPGALAVQLRLGVVLLPECT